MACRQAGARHRITLVTAYLLVKFFHVFFAITAVGANLTYGVWFARANADPKSAATILRGVKFIDDRIANPAYGLLLLTGLGEVFVGHYSFTTLWILWALVLYVILVVIAAGFYTPTLKRQVEAVVKGGVKDAGATALATRGQFLAGLMGVLVVGILVLMIFKPT